MQLSEGTKSGSRPEKQLALWRRKVYTDYHWKQPNQEWEWKNRILFMFLLFYLKKSF